VSPVAAACPSCGATIEFRFDDTFVRVCPYCNAVVARGDRGFDALGRLGDLAASGSPLALFAAGGFEGVPFQLVGRAQIQHAAGGGWEEWYARFDDGRWGWLSEAQGRFQLFFAVPDAAAPAFESLRPGATVDLPAGRFAIAEVGEASYRAAAGEMPYRLAPGERFRYADLSGADGRAATVDYGRTGSADRPTLYLGREVSLAELHIQAPASAAPERAPERVAGRHVACPQCKGSLELRAPDIAQRVACPYCGAVLDVDQGNLAYLKTLDRSQRFTPDIPLGSTVTLDDGELTVIGCLLRHAIVGGIEYPFTEYLLYRPEVGYRWLVESAGHWTYAAPLPAGEVEADFGSRATWQGRRFRHFQGCRGAVAGIYGELTWKAEVGETVVMDDFTRPPALLSCERGDGEVNWSLGRYVGRAELAAAVRPAGDAPLSLPVAIGVAPNQPFPHRGLFRLTGVLLLLLAVIGITTCARAPRRDIDISWEPPGEVDADGAAQVMFSKPFELSGGENLHLRVAADVDNSWVALLVDLVNQDTGELTAFDLGVEYYHGYEGGESWSEGSRREDIYLPPVTAGTYVMRIERQHQPGLGAPPITELTLRQGVYRGLYFWLAGAGLLIIPLFTLIYRVWFEKKRWSESDHAGGDQ
jgi:hypothetical protein